MRFGSKVQKGPRVGHHHGRHQPRDGESHTSGGRNEVTEGGQMKTAHPKH